MVLYLLVNLALGVEGGINQPLIGFDNLNSGVVFNVSLSNDLGVVGLSLALQGSFYQGKNPGYSLGSYGARFEFTKHNWRFTPVIELGSDYIYRELNQLKESGFTLSYGIGFQLKFRYESIRVYPEFLYDGLTDFSTQAGFLGIRLGIGYEL